MDNSGHLISTIRLADDDLELNIHTNQIHYLSIQAEANINDLIVVKDFCFSVHHQDHYTLKMIDDIEQAYKKNTHSESPLFFSMENDNDINPEEIIFKLEQPINCTVFNSLSNYYDFSADVSPDFICIEHDLDYQHSSKRLSFININYVTSIDVYRKDDERSSLLQFNKSSNKNTITLYGGSLYNLKKFDVVVWCGGMPFKVDMDHLIQVFNKQIYGSIDSYRSKMMERRLRSMVNILNQFKRVEQFLLMDNEPMMIQ